MMHGTLPIYGIYMYKVSSNYFHLLRSYTADKENIVNTYVQNVYICPPFETSNLKPGC